ncbi:hypothetical protein [Rhodanobacter thiooxydans]|uniref:hypothetical protein n=1 Tax=Rhodanobacter thiooxydans TaxID=416169 RepID=UPI000260D60A|nr:hypothetical protein [Rhodanobacter thiooxydans]EIL98534.1 OmpA/MotB domain-containing protein [Rhodanobacter thiooxydans LCS2]
MKHSTATLATLALALAVLGPAHARQDDIDISRLTNSLNQLANDPGMGNYAQAEQARAHDAINRLAQASSRERPHVLYLAERRVDLAKTAAQLQDAQVKLTQLDREHDQILLDNSRRDAEMARRELERQRLQYQLAQEEAARLQAQGQEYSQAADQARAEAERAKKLAAAQSKVAKAAKRQAELAAQAAKAMRSQMEDADKPAETSTSKQHP